MTSYLNVKTYVIHKAASSQRRTEPWPEYVMNLDKWFLRQMSGQTYASRHIAMLIAVLCTSTLVGAN